MSIKVPTGFQMAGVHAGIKQLAETQDVSLIVSDRACSAAGVYTQNLVFAAPVALDRERTPSDQIRAVVINSGNANACTGEQGMADAREMARLAAEACGAEADQVLVLSTGVIGEFLPLAKVAAGIKSCAAALGADEAAFTSAARGMMTTDTTHKTASRTLTLGGKSITLAGMSKGAAMIGPNMATMLGLMLTDAALSPDDAQAMLKDVADQTFNCISVDGHMSTNDTVLLLANGAAGGDPLAGEELQAFKASLLDLCSELAMAIPRDGEGATHLITIDVTGCKDRESARQIARNVADSPLVKTAVAGADPNWGRIVSAAGYSGIPFNPAGVDLRLNGFLVYQQGTPLDFDEAEVSLAMKNSRDTSIELSFSEGSASIRFWTTDLTAEYVRLNADYRT